MCTLTMLFTERLLPTSRSLWTEISSFLNLFSMQLLGKEWSVRTKELYVIKTPVAIQVDRLKSAIRRVLWLFHVRASFIKWMNLFTSLHLQSSRTCIFCEWWDGFPCSYSHMIPWRKCCWTVQTWMACGKGGYAKGPYSGITPDWAMRDMFIWLHCSYLKQYSLFFWLAQTLASSDALASYSISGSCYKQCLEVCKMACWEGTTVW